MTYNQAVNEIREILEQPEPPYSGTARLGNHLHAIKWARKALGLSFHSARTMVREIKQDAPWYRCVPRKRR